MRKELLDDTNLRWQINQCLSVSTEVYSTTTVCPLELRTEPTKLLNPDNSAIFQTAQKREKNINDGHAAL
jgi:hypothetical protein